MNTRSQSKLKNLPSTVDYNEVIKYIDDCDINSSYLNILKDYSHLNDVDISSIFDLNVKTYRSYKSTKRPLSERLKEQMVALLTLFKHGKAVFGNKDEFTKWLKVANFYFDGNSPEKNLKTMIGIKFIDDRLTAMEYGDNV